MELGWLWFKPIFGVSLAYSSVSHLGFVVVGLFALNYQGLQGSLLTMINLGFSTAGLFFIAGFLYSRQQTTQLGSFGGMAKQAPLLATFFLIIGLASIGFPAPMVLSVSSSSFWEHSKPNGGLVPSPF